MSDKVVEEKNPLRVSIDFRENCNKGAVFDYIRQSIKLFIFQSRGKEISENLDGLKEKVGAFLEELSTEEIASIAGWDYILSALATVA
jgi:hypothetical protein